MKVRNWLVGLIFILAIAGLGSYVFNNPAGLLRQIFFMAAAAAAIYAIYRLWIAKKPGSSENRSFAKAARQSKKRAKTRQSASAGNTFSHARKRPFRKKSAAHLTVIEGKKSKKKDRAIF
ncbi:MAG TPA: SA1362 family protein [Bacillaceae bacterium]